MKRLFTFGCSFTKYAWPTWADFLGLEFDHFENWGCPGIGNRAILERIAECHSKSKFNSTDTVIVQWSTHLRHDYHRFSNHDTDTTATAWKTAGSVFNFLNASKYTDSWLKEYFDEKSYIMHSLNSMVAAKNLLENSKCTWYMTSVGEFEKLGADITAPGTFGESSNILDDLWEKHIEFDHYRQTIWQDKSRWCEPFSKILAKNNQNLYKWPVEDDLTKTWIDPHPTAEIHLQWLNNNLKPKLDIPTDSSNCNEWLDVIQDLKKNSYTLREFAELLHRKIPSWEINLRGH